MTGSRLVNRRQIDSQKNYLYLQRKLRDKSMIFFSKFGAEQYCTSVFKKEIQNILKSPIDQN